MSVPDKSDNSGVSPATVRVKEEREWDGVDDAAGLYAEHEVKDELVLGPERLQPQDIAYALHASVSSSRGCPEAVAQELAEEAGAETGSPGEVPRPGQSCREQAVPRTCSVRLERILVDKKMHPCETCLYAEHEVKDELVLGPEQLQPQDIVYALHAPLSSSRGCPEAVEQELAEAAGAETGSPGEVPRPGRSCREQAVPRTCSVRLERVPVDDKLHPCETCFKIFLHKTSLMTHICVCRANDVKVKDSLEKNKFSCDTCGKWFVTKSELIRHIYMKENHCSSEVSKSGESKLHVVNKGEKSHHCDICKKQFKQRASIATHRLIHTGEKPHHCNICKKLFSQKSNLTKHRLIHTGEKPHHCNICKKQFSVKHSLSVHLLVHTREKPHHCNICKKQFSQKWHLVRHRLIHTGEKPHHCNTCKKQFTQKCDLNKHRLIHTGEKPHHCNICKKQFSVKYALSVHLLVHTREKPHHCNICKKQFSQKSSLHKHQVIHIREKPRNGKLMAAV